MAFVLIAAACSGPVASQATTTQDTGVDDRPSITVPVTFYRLIDTDGSGLGTSRTTEEIEAIATAVAEIWEQAGIALDPINVREIELPASVLAPIVASGEIDPFVRALNSSVEVPDPGAINGFFLSQAFGVNGFAPFGRPFFFVVDEPTVPDQRVTSHEIGHIFGLHHDGTDATRLMFSGTDGETLTTTEQTVARYAAQGILDGQR